jgi:uncharacterized protein
MKQIHVTRLAMLVSVAALIGSPQSAAQPVGAAAAPEGAQIYTVFLRSRAVGQETVAVMGQTDGWLVKGSNRLGAPLDVVTRNAEIHYDLQWRPARLLIEGTSRGQDLSIKTTFANGQASTEIMMAGTSSSKTDPVAADTLVLPNGFLGSYAALARRLVGAKPGAVFRGYIVPHGEVPMRLDGIFAERIDTPRQAIAATRYTLVVTNPPPQGEVQVSVWTDASGALLRMSVPAQTLELAREDIASAATRTTSFSLPGDETVRIPAAGFGIGASITKPASAPAPLPAIVLIGGSGSTDRDGFVAGVPILGQLAADLVAAGFFVVRYDKRGVGQSGGRTETSTLNDYAEDARAIVAWLDKQRRDVDKKRIALVGHSEGAWVAMRAAAQDKRVAAVALIAAPAVTGSELVLEQQRHALERMKIPDAEKQAKVELQKQINAAALKGSGWEGVPNELRVQADTLWFQSFLGFDPARVMKDIRQPVLIVQGELDTQVPVHHADRLAELARGRKRKTAVDLVKVPGVNHLLLPAKTGDVEEYAGLTEKKVSSAAASAIAAWLDKAMRPR